MPPEERLDSWKEIASFLKRDVSTVQRWEKREGMPVHRHMHNRLASVYAYRSELEAWWANRHAGLEAEDRIPGRRVSWKTAASVLGVAIGTVLAVASLRLMRSSPQGMILQEVADPSDVLFWGGGPSAAGRYIPFTESEAGNLSLLDLHTGETRPLTAKTSWSESPEYAQSYRISPDGKEVAYSWFSLGDFFDLRLAAIDGSASRIVYREEDVRDLGVCGFMPDGRSVLVIVSKEASVSRLAVVPLDGGPTQTVRTFEGESPFGVSLSPDGRYAAYDLPARSGAGDRDLFLASIEDGRETALDEHPSQDLWPLWTPDGAAVLFASDRSGDQSLWKIPVADGSPDGAPELVFKEMGRGRPLGLTGKGAYYYLLQTGSSDVSIAELEGSGGTVTSVRVASPWFIGSNLSPDWSSDGRKLAYVSHRGTMTWGSGSRALVIRDLETGDDREIVPEMNFFTHPRWSPDGQTILVKGGTRDQKWGLHRIRVADGAIGTVFLRGSFGDFDWDGAAVYYERDSEIVKREIDGGGEEVVYRAITPWNLGGLALSRDGRWLAFLTSIRDGDSWTQALTIMSSAGGATRELMRVRQPDALKLGDWTADGQAVFFIRFQEPEENDRELWRVPVALGEPEPVRLAAKGLRDVRVRPGGGSLAFSSGWPDYSLWVMESFLSDGS